MNKDLLIALGWGGTILLVASVASALRSQGYIDQEGVLRVIAMNGLVAAYYGNLVPKVFAPSANVRAASRVTGWALVLGGLAYAGFWAFAPISVAKTLGTGSLAVGLTVALAYCAWLRSSSKAAAQD